MKVSYLYWFLPLLLFGCSTTMDPVISKTEKPDNAMNAELNTKLLDESLLPYGAPEFNEYDIEEYRGAMLEAMRLQNLAIDAITNVRSTPTFENTIVRLEKSGKKLNKVGNIFNALAGAHTNKQIKEIQSELAPKLAEHRDGIFLNRELYNKIKYVYDNQQQYDLNAEDEKLLEEYYTDFIIAGAALSDRDKKKLKEINARIAQLQTEFNQTLLEANNAAAITIKDKSLLAGIPENMLKSMQSEDGKSWTIKLHNTTQQPILQYLENRDLRKKVYEASLNRTQQGEYRTADIVKEIAQLRASKGQLLGYDNYAEWSLQKTMVKTPQAVIAFLDGLIPAAVANAQREAEELQQLINESGVPHELKPYDWNFYAEKLRKKKYDLDEEEIKPYFELNNVLENGVFYAATQLFGITFEKRTDFPVYHEDVLVYEVFDKDGEPLALFYGDFFSRDSKRGGAWMSNFVTQSKLWNKKPVVYNVCNNPKPAEGDPALLTYDQVETIFHEFGHALHGIFADQMYPSLSGTSVARDFVEFPSQLNEYWALYPDVLKNYAKHYETGEPMPQSLVDKIKNSATFNQGYALTELLTASMLDMQWHMLDSKVQIHDIDEFQNRVLKTKGLIPEVVPSRYNSTYFAHVFGGGYGAGYYSYLWTEMLMHDAYKWFEENGGLTRENGQRYRDLIISQGNTKDYEEMYQEFAGEAEPEPMLRARGL